MYSHLINPFIVDGFTIRIRTERPSIPSAGMDGISRGGGAINKQY